MGTNYYTKVNFCTKCKRGEEIHLGKSSAGWKFAFQYNGQKFYKDIKEMKEWLKGKVIKNEYGERVSNKSFWKLVESKQDQRSGHTATKDGNYDFYDYEFS